MRFHLIIVFPFVITRRNMVHELNTQMAKVNSIASSTTTTTTVATVLSFQRYQRSDKIRNTDLSVQHLCWQFFSKHDGFVIYSYVSCLILTGTNVDPGTHSIGDIVKKPE